MSDRTDTRYATVERQLLAELAQGRYPVGSRFPTEMELCARFGVSRHTVREALRRLSDMGLLQRHQGSGTLVRALRKPAGFSQSIASLTELYQYAVDTRLLVEHEAAVTVRGALAESMGCAADSRWLRFEGLRVGRGDGVAVCWTEIYLADAFSALRERVGREITPVHVMIEEAGRTIRRVEQELRAVNIPAGVAARLGVVPDSAGLRITRRYLGEDGEPLEVTFSIHPAERMHYRITLRRE